MLTRWPTVCRLLLKNTGRNNQRVSRTDTENWYRTGNMPWKSPTSEKLGAVCRIVSSTGQKPSVIKQVDWQWQMDVLHQEHETCALLTTGAQLFQRPFLHMQTRHTWKVHLQRGGLERLIYPNGLASVRAGKDQWDRPSLYITENNVDEIKNVSSNKRLLTLQGLIWECVQISIPTLSR